jgi:hypothetical protein
LDAGDGKISKSKDPNAKEMNKYQWLKEFVPSFLVIFHGSSLAFGCLAFVIF